MSLRVLLLLVWTICCCLGWEQRQQQRRSSVPIFFLHLLKHKHYLKIEKVNTTPPATDCICVPYYLCDMNQTIVTDGVGLIDVRFVLKAGGEWIVYRFRRCTGDLEVCCYPPTASMAPIVTPTIPPPTTPTIPPPPPTTPTMPPPPPTTPTMPPPPPTTPTTPTPPPTTPTMPPPPPTTMSTPMPIPTAPPIVFPTETPAPPIPIPTAIPTAIVPTIPPGFYCVCVPAQQCDSTGFLLTGGEGLINPRQQSVVCAVPGQVCCNLPTNSGSNNLLPTSGQAQICFVCGGTVQCINGVLLPGGDGIINPRLTYPTCPGGQGQALNTVDNGLTLNGLGPLKNPGTPTACYCVKSWLCLEGNAVSVDGLGIVDPRFTACPIADEVCCRPGGIDFKAMRAIPPSMEGGAFIVNPPTSGSSSQVQCGTRDDIFAPDTPYPKDSGKTYFAEFPWMVALLIQQTNGQFLFKCGASLITSRAALTAAHCVANRENGKLIARFGQWDLEEPKQIIPYEEMDVQTIVPHPLYYSGALYHDVAVLIFGRPVTFNTNIRPICLPGQGVTFTTGTKCVGTGWGRNSFGTEGKYQAELRKVEVPIVDRADCQSRLRGTKLGQFFQLHGSFICAGGEPNRDTCQGDGGGPLACPTATGRFVQAGIVSWGIGCGSSNVPAVYASVSQHRQWIDQQLATYGAQ